LISPSLVGHLNGLIIITSAYLAIAQYFDNRHKSEHDTVKAKLEKLTFDLNEQDSGMGVAKEIWEKTYGKVQERIKLGSSVIFLFIMLIIYLSLHLSFVSNLLLNWLAYGTLVWTIIPPAIITLIFSFFMGKQVLEMKKEKEFWENEVRHCLDVYNEAVKRKNNKKPLKADEVKYIA